MTNSTDESWPILVTIPHDGSGVPDPIWSAMLATGESQAGLRHRILSGGDPYTGDIFDWPRARAMVRTPISRFVVDVNRSVDADGPNGVIKTADFDALPFYSPDFVLGDAERERRLQAYYHPFFADIEARLLQAKGEIRLLIDGHSMSAYGPEIGPDSGSRRPAICLATEVEVDGAPRPACPPAMAAAAAAAAEQAIAREFPSWPADHRVLLNNPFNGGYILRRFTQGDQGGSSLALPGIMVECNRALYLDETTLLPLPGRIEKLRAITQVIAMAALAWYTSQPHFPAQPEAE